LMIAVDKFTIFSVMVLCWGLNLVLLNSNTLSRIVDY